MTASKSYYNKNGLWALYLACAFPLFFWTLLLSFRDVSWLAERTNAWDAIGVVSYGMLFAFVESLALFVIAILLGFFVSRSWSVDHRIALVSVLVLILSFWAMFGQAYFVWGFSVPRLLFDLAIYTGRPVFNMYILLSGLVLPSVVLPAYFILRTEKGLSAVKDFMERLSLLSMLYLFFAVIGLVIVFLRNI